MISRQARGSCTIWGYLHDIGWHAWLGAEQPGHAKPKNDCHQYLYLPLSHCGADSLVYPPSYTCTSHHDAGKIVIAACTCHFEYG